MEGDAQRSRKGNRLPASRTRREPDHTETLLDAGVFVNRPPQSIAALSEDRYQSLKPLTRLGFDF